VFYVGALLSSNSVVSSKNLADIIHWNAHQEVVMAETIHAGLQSVSADGNLKMQAQSGYVTQECDQA
jgi:hypothetical protein